MIGIIYCPKEELLRAEHRGKEVCDYLDQKQQPYDYRIAKGRKAIEQTAFDFAHEGVNTLLVVGGDAALNCVLNGLISADPTALECMSIGVVPNGYANDWARYWGITEGKVQEAMDWFLKGRVRKVDVGYCKSMGEGSQPVTRYFLNCVNVGLVGEIMQLKHKTFHLWGLTTLSYLNSMLLLLFKRKLFDMNLEVNYEHVERTLMNVCLGSCHSYGLTPNAVPYSGMLDVTLVSHPKLTKLFGGLYLLLTGRFLRHSNVNSYRTRTKIKFKENDKAKVSLDGVVWQEAKCPMEIGVLPEALQFIIP